MAAYALEHLFLRHGKVCAALSPSGSAGGQCGGARVANDERLAVRLEESAECWPAHAPPETEAVCRNAVLQRAETHQMGACVLPLHAHVRPDDLGYDTALGVQYCDITGAMAQVEAARLRADERFGVITFASADAARAAAAALNGTQLCGEALAVTAIDPQAGARTSKRPRVAA